MYNVFTQLNRKGVRYHEREQYYKMQNKTERIVITVDAELKQELTEKANVKRITLSGLGRNLLVEWLEQQK